MSKMLNVNLCLNIAVPSAKPKYVLTIDSELVAWVKDEKVIKNIVVEKTLKFITYKLLECCKSIIAYLLHKGPTS